MPLYAERVVVSADPAAGSDLAYTADEGDILHSFAGLLTTDATVANRQIQVSLEDSSGNVMFRSLSSTQVAASQASTRVEGYSGAPAQAPGLNHSVVPLPDLGLKMRAGDVLRIVAINKGPADDLSAFYMLLERL